jgi:hypothetical protein
MIVYLTKDKPQKKHVILSERKRVEGSWHRFDCKCNCYCEDPSTPLRSAQDDKLVSLLRETIIYRAAAQEGGGGRCFFIQGVENYGIKAAAEGYNLNIMPKNKKDVENTTFFP